MLEPWWDRFPEVVRDEERSLERLGGRPPVLNDELLASANVREYATAATVEGETYHLVVRYSDFHPYLKLEVIATHRFTTHQHPFGGQLCLLRSGTWGWDVTETAGDFITGQLERLVADIKARDQREDGARTTAPDHHVEPFAGYYGYLPEAAIRVDGSWPDITEADSGLAIIGLEPQTEPGCLRGMVLDVADPAGQTLRRADEAVWQLFPHRIQVRWRRLPARPQNDGPSGLLEAIADAGPLPPLRGQRRLGQTELDVVAGVFTDDLRPGVRGDAWMFVVGGTGPKKAKGRVTTADKLDPYLVRAYRAGRDDLTERVPSLSPLRSKKAVAVGSGGVGAPTIIELCKAGIGELVVFEGDTVDPGNSPRWPLGFGAAGRAKLVSLQSLIRWNWPYVKLEFRPLMLGAVRDGGGIPPHWEIPNEALQSADLLLDLTAEVGMGYFLSDVAREFGVPCIAASVTEGGWGGRVVRFGDGVGMCWTCLMHHEKDDEDLIPSSDPDPATRSVWPRGCVDPTFTGAGFDLGAIAMAAARLAASTLCEGEISAYPQVDWNLAVFKFRDQRRTYAGGAIEHTLGVHPACEVCRFRAAS